MRLKVSRQEIPASTRIRVDELSTIALFPRLPLASTETETPMSAAYSSLLWKRDNFVGKPIPLSDRQQVRPGRFTATLEAMSFQNFSASKSFRGCGIVVLLPNAPRRGLRTYCWNNSTAPSALVGSVQNSVGEIM